jgi:hypothetical protein
MDDSLVHIYRAPRGGFLSVPLARLSGGGPWAEVEPVEVGVDASALERALARSAELSGSGDLPEWDGGGVRDGARLVARVEAKVDGGLAYVPQRHVQDEYGSWWADENPTELASLDAVAERVRRDAGGEGG